jgi:hypothetical protein
MPSACWNYLYLSQKLAEIGPWVGGRLGASPAAIPPVYAAAAPASVPPSDADLLDAQRPLRRTDSADFRPRKQKESRGLPTPVTRIGR